MNFGEINFRKYRIWGIVMRPGLTRPWDQILVKVLVKFLQSTVTIDRFPNSKQILL